MKYLVSLFYDTITREYWEIEAPDRDEAIRKAQAGEGISQGEKTQDGELVMTEIEELDYVES